MQDFYQYIYCVLIVGLLHPPVTEQLQTCLIYKTKIKIKCNLHKTFYITGIKVIINVIPVINYYKSLPLLLLIIIITFVYLYSLIFLHILFYITFMNAVTLIYFNSFLAV